MQGGAAPFFHTQNFATDWHRKKRNWITLLQMFYKCLCLLFPVSPNAYQVLITLTYVEFETAKKRVKVISSIGMWPYRPSLTKILSPTLMSSTVNNPSARAYSLVTWVERRVKQQACNSPAAKEKKGWTLLYIGAVFTSLIIYYQMCAAARFHLELITNESETYEKNVTFY